MDHIKKFFEKFGRKPTLKEEVSLLKYTAPYFQAREAMQKEGTWVGSDKGQDSLQSPILPPDLPQDHPWAGRNSDLTRGALEIEKILNRGATIADGDFLGQKSRIAVEVPLQMKADLPKEKKGKELEWEDTIPPPQDKIGRRRLIDDAIDEFSIDMSAVAGFRYNPGLSHGGLTDDNRNVEIGLGAFEGTKGWLGASIAHETEVHAKMVLEDRDWWLEAGEDEIEVPDYQYMIDQASRFGLPPEEVSILRGLRDYHQGRLEAKLMEKVDAKINERIDNSLKVE